MIFLKQPTEPLAAVDPEYELRHNDYTKTNITIQDATAYGGGYVVNECGPDDDFWVEEVGAASTLEKAKKIALAHFASRNS